jgi:hypothetical protein
MWQTGRERKGEGRGGANGKERGETTVCQWRGCVQVKNQRRIMVTDTTNHALDVNSLFLERSIGPGSEMVPFCVVVVSFFFPFLSPVILRFHVFLHTHPRTRLHLEPPPPNPSTPHHQPTLYLFPSNTTTAPSARSTPHLFPSLPIPSLSSLGRLSDKLLRDARVLEARLLQRPPKVRQLPRGEPCLVRGWFKKKWVNRIGSIDRGV